VRPFIARFRVGPRARGARDHYAMSCGRDYLTASAIPKQQVRGGGHAARVRALEDRTGGVEVELPPKIHAIMVLYESDERTLSDIVLVKISMGVTHSQIDAFAEHWGLERHGGTTGRSGMWTISDGGRLYVGLRESMEAGRELPLSRHSHSRAFRVAGRSVLVGNYCDTLPGASGTRGAGARYIRATPVMSLRRHGEVISSVALPSMDFKFIVTLLDCVPSVVHMDGPPGWLDRVNSRVASSRVCIALGNGDEAQVHLDRLTDAHQGEYRRMIVGGRGSCSPLPSVNSWGGQTKVPCFAVPVEVFPSPDGPGAMYSSLSRHWGVDDDGDVVEGVSFGCSITRIGFSVGGVTFEASSSKGVLTVKKAGVPWPALLASLRAEYPTGSLMKINPWNPCVERRRVEIVACDDSIFCRASLRRLDHARLRDFYYDGKPYPRARLMSGMTAKGTGKGEGKSGDPYYWSWPELFSIVATRQDRVRREFPFEVVQDAPVPASLRTKESVPAAVCSSVATELARHALAVGMRAPPRVDALTAEIACKMETEVEPRYALPPREAWMYS